MGVIVEPQPHRKWLTKTLGTSVLTEINCSASGKKKKSKMGRGDKSIDDDHFYRLQIQNKHTHTLLLLHSKDESCHSKNKSINFTAIWPSAMRGDNETIYNGAAVSP